MPGGWGQDIGVLLLLIAPLVLVLGDRLLIWYLSCPRPYALAPVPRLGPLLGLVRLAFLATVIAGVALLPPT